MTEQTCRCSRTLFQTFFMLKTEAYITQNTTRQLTARGFGCAFAPSCSVRFGWLKGKICENARNDKSESRRTFLSISCQAYRKTWWMAVNVNEWVKCTVLCKILPLKINKLKKSASKEPDIRVIV